MSRSSLDVAGRKAIHGVGNMCKGKVTLSLTGKCLNCNLESFEYYYQGQISYFSVGKSSKTVGTLLFLGC